MVIFMNYKEFADIIKTKRKIKGYKAYEFAMMLGIQRIRYTRIENGKLEPNFTELMMISKLLDIDLTAIYKNEKTSQVKHFD